MNSSGFPLDKTNRQLSHFDPLAKEDAYDEPSGLIIGAAPGYNSLWEYWRVVVAHRMKLLGFALIGLVGAITVSLLQTPIYRVRTSLEIQGPNYMESKGGGPTEALITPESYLETQVKLLQSESLLELVIDKVKLQNEQPASGWRGFPARVRRIFSLSSPVQDKEKLVQRVQRNLTVRVSGNSRLVELIYESEDPKQAADFVNTLVSEFIEQTQEMRWKSAQGTSDWLTNHLDNMKGQLEASEAQLQSYARTSGLSPASEKDIPAETRLSQIQDELSKAQADRIAKEAKFEEARGKPVDSLPDILEDPTMRDYRQRLADLERQYVELSATLTPEHYKVQRVQAQINELKSEMEKERKDVVSRMGNEYAAAVRRETLLSQAHANQEREVADESAKAIHYDTLKRDVDSNRRLYETMLQRVKEASLTTAMRDSNAVVIDRAKPPLIPYRPDLPVNSAIGLFSCLFLGFGFVLLQERLDRKISAPGDTRITLDLPELGVIPLDETAASNKFLEGLHVDRSIPVPVAESIAGLPPGECPELATWKRKPSLLAECVRTTLTSILLPGQDEERPRVVVLTSASPGDGKTTVACNLGIAVAETGRKVLLIDGDLRRPRLHRVFSVKNDSGLSDVLWAKNSLEAIPLAHLVRESEVSGLSLLPAGSCGVPPANLLYSPRMADLLKRLRTEFDMIVIDAPPMMFFADARVLGRLADGVILVIRAGRTKMENARSATQRFAEDGTRVLGTVLNSWDPKSPGRYGYGTYGDYETYVRQ
jgi:succinoglycan biosynthesis transport protein ExoP